MSEKPLLPLKEAYPFGAEKGLGEAVEKIKTMEIEWDRPYTSSLRRGYITYLFQEHGIFEEFKKKHWPFGNTATGQSFSKSELRKKSLYDDFLATGNEADNAAQDLTGGEENDREFAAESDLRDFLVKNLNCIEKGLSLYEDQGKLGAEFSIDEGRGRIDLLAVDAEKRFVVIELKLGRGRNKTIGQLLYYMGWVDNNLSKTPCRGIIIAKEIPTDLILAAKRVPGVSLYNYSLSVTVSPVPLT